MSRPTLSLCLILALSTLAAEPKKKAPTPIDPMNIDFLADKERDLRDRFLARATTKEQWERVRPRLREQYLQMLGLWPLPESTPLHAKITGTLEKSEVLIDKLHFQSQPGLYVTGNLYRPKPKKDAAVEKLPTILYVCGHSGRGRDGNKTAFQDHGLWFANNGYNCLVIDTLQLGEVAGKHHGTYNLGRMWWQAAGYTPAGVECINGIRALDYLASRPDVDADRLGVTGISGGGASTFWIAAADPRVKVAVPVSGMSDLQTYVKDKVVNGHCDCMFLVNTYQWEWTTIAALVAPRPMLFANSDMDTIFPMPGNRRIIERLRKLYQFYDKPELVDEHVSPGGHDYRADLRLAIFKWFNRHLKNDTAAIKDADFPPIPGKELRVFPEDADLPADSINNRADEVFLAKWPRPTVPAAADFAAWREDLLAKLRQKSFRSHPDPLPAASIFLRANEGDNSRDMLVTEPLITCALDYRKGLDGKGDIGTLFVVFPGEELNVEAIKPYRGDGPVRRLTVRQGGTGEVPHYVERSHALLGLTVDGGRVRDVIATIRHLHDNDSQGRTWRVVGKGSAGIIAAYAALYEPAIAEVVVIDPPATHKVGPIFLNVLQVLDIPDALGLIAPKTLTLVNAKDKAFDRTAEIYDRAGSAKKLIRK